MARIIHAMSGSSSWESVMLYSGIDLHKRDLVIATVDASGQSVAAKRIRPTNQAVRAYFEQFSPQAEHRAVVEATRSWYWLNDVLRTMAPTTPVTLTLANPGRLRAISAAKVKTDAVDADTLARISHEGIEKRSPRVV